MSNIWLDIRYGVRMLARRPGFTIVAILTLALGIGANTAIFSVVNGVLLNPLPYPRADELVTLHESKPNFETGSISYPNFLDWQQQNHTFAGMALSRGSALSLTGMGQAERLQAKFVSSGFFPVLEVKPVIGRFFTADEDQFGAGPVALISTALWKRKFGSSPAVLGITLTLDGRDFAVIGVVAQTFDRNFGLPDIYAPITQWQNPNLRYRGAGLGLHGIGRLEPGVTIEQARADMAQVTRNLTAAYPDFNQGIGATILPMKQDLVGNVQPYLLVLLAAVAFVLLIACVNVANLLLARSTSRAREFAIRAALGAGQGRVIRQLLTESVLLGAAGGGVGLLLAAWGTKAALAALPSGLPRASEIALDGRVIFFTAAISLAAGILFGLAPALKTSRTDLQETLKEGGRGVAGGRSRAHSILVVAETALALVLLVGAGLMVRTMARLWGVDPGFDPHHVTTFGLALPPSMFHASPDAIRARFRAVDQKLAAVPGVSAVSLSWGALPMSTEDDGLFWIEGQPKPTREDQMSWTLSYVVEPDYLKAMRITLERGRFFSSTDDEHAPMVAVIDDVFAQKFFPHQNPVGKRIFFPNVGDNDPLEIVGVVGHVKQWGLASDDTQSLRAEIYTPFMQMGDKPIVIGASGVEVVVRTEGEPGAAFDSLRRASTEMSADQVIYGVQTMDEIISDSLNSSRFLMILLGAFAVLALLLASIGTYGVISYLVGQRTHEIGVRMALGAERRHVLRLVVGQGSTMALVGVGVGIVAALGLTRLLVRYSILFGVGANDPLTYAGVAVLLTVVALGACYIPARRAMNVDPVTALRYE